jgi:hypothetical protein
MQISSVQFIMAQSIGAHWCERMTNKNALQSLSKRHIKCVKQVAELLQQFCIACQQQQQQQPTANTAAPTASATASTGTATASTAAATATVSTADAVEQCVAASTDIMSISSTAYSNSPAIEAIKASMPQSARDIVKVQV